MSTTRRILDAEALYLEAHFAKGGSGSTTSEAGTYDDDVEFTLIGRIHQFQLSLRDAAERGIHDVFNSHSMNYCLWILDY